MNRDSKIKLTLPELNNHPNPYKGLETPNKPITDEEAFTKMFNLITEKDYPVSKKYFCIMLFFQQADFTNNPNDREWANTRNVYYHNGQLALDYYANTRCPASQLIDADSISELIQKRNQMLLNFKDKTFIQNLQEYI